MSAVEKLMMERVERLTLELAVAKTLAKQLLFAIEEHRSSDLTNDDHLKLWEVLR